ncbi:MAG: hypothetical protein PVJ67_01960 [Candidatus Pacearchaeota archaeon]|jgi:uncharacterized membrane protein YraQ (UPF0718 family)
MKKRKIGFATLFFLAMVVVYLISFFVNPDYTKIAFDNFLKAFLKLFPLILIVFGFMFFINIFLRPEKISKYLGEKSGIKAWVYTLFPCLLIPAPPYVIFPLLGELKKAGMKNSLIVYFLYNRNIQVAFIPAMTYYFGVSFTIVAASYIFIFSIISGLFIERLVNKK